MGSALRVNGDQMIFTGWTWRLADKGALYCLNDYGSMSKNFAEGKIGSGYEDTIGYTIRDCFIRASAYFGLSVVVEQLTITPVTRGDETIACVTMLVRRMTKTEAARERRRRGGG